MSKNWEKIGSLRVKMHEQKLGKIGSLRVKLYQQKLKKLEKNEKFKTKNT